MRFQDMGVDNKVPGPTRYFDDRREEEASVNLLTSLNMS